MHIDILPNEIMINIFTCLSNINCYYLLVTLPSVSKKWRKICKNLITNATIRMSDLKFINNKKLFLYKFLHNINSVRELYFDSYFDLEDEFWKLFDNKLKKTTIIDFENFNKNNFSIIYDIEKYCPNIKKIVYSRYIWIKIINIHKFKKLETIIIPYSSILSFNDYDNIFNFSLFNLKNLTLRDCRGLKTKDLVKISTACPLLEKLDIRGCDCCLNKNLLTNYMHNLKDYKYLNSNEDNLGLLLKNKKILNSIHVNEYYCRYSIFFIPNCYYFLKKIHINDSNIDDIFCSKLVEICPKLEKIYFDYCQIITDKSVNIFINKLYWLKELTINSCDCVTFRRDINLTTSCKNITSICFNLLAADIYLGNQNIQKLIYFLPNLTKISLDYFSEAFEIYKFLNKKIKYLSIPGFKYGEKEYKYIAKCCNLVYFDNSDNGNFSLECLRILTHNCKYLNYIYLRRIKNIFLTDISIYIKKLKLLDFSINFSKI